MKTVYPCLIVGEGSIVGFGGKKAKHQRLGELFRTIPIELQVYEIYEDNILQEGDNDEIVDRERSVFEDLNKLTGNIKRIFLQLC